MRVTDGDGEEFLDLFNRMVLNPMWDSHDKAGWPMDVRREALVLYRRLLSEACQFAEIAHNGNGLLHIYRWLAEDLWDEDEGFRITKVPIPALLRMRVLERDNHMCVACGSTENLAADHVIPESKGGPTIYQNLQTLCRSCNSIKGASL